MASATSTSKRPLHVVNDRCVLRRNVRTQPYGRCSVCDLRLRQCHAWQSSAISFLLIVAILSVLALSEDWTLRLLALGVIGLVVAQGVLNHNRTDELIFGAHELSRASARLREQNATIERTVEVRTAELRRANQALARANLEAISAQRHRDVAVVDLSHDLRTPITAITGAAQNLLDGLAGPLVPDQREYVEIIRDHARRLGRAGETIIDAARSAPRDVRLEPAPIDVNLLAREVVRGLAPVAHERNVAVEVRGEAVSVQADCEKLRAIVENLLSNALKFTDAGGWVVVETAPEASGARIAVRDTGIGMTEEQRGRIFDRFYRADEGRPGSGVGLAIVQSLVHLHGGRLSVDSTPGGGSEFSVTLPSVAS